MEKIESAVSGTRYNIRNDLCCQTRVSKFIFIINFLLPKFILLVSFFSHFLIFIIFYSSLNKIISLFLYASFLLSLLYFSILDMRELL